MKSEEWRIRSRLTIGASVASVAGFGDTVFRMTPRRLALEMIDAAAGVAPPDEDNPDIRRGTFFEPVAAKLAERSVGKLTRWPQDDALRHTAYPWAHATPDYLDEDGNPLEIKVPRALRVPKIVNDGPPLYWYAQAQQTMALGGFPRTRIAVFDTDNVKIELLDVAYKSEWALSMLEGERRFAASVASGQVPDEAVDAEAAEGAKAGEPPREYPTLTTPEAVRLAEHIVRIAQAEREARSVSEGLKKRLVEMAARAVYGDGYKPGESEPVGFFVVDGVDIEVNERAWDAVRVFNTLTKPPRRFSRDLADRLIRRAIAQIAALAERLPESDAERDRAVELLKSIGASPDGRSWSDDAVIERGKSSRPFRMFRHTR